MLTHRPGVRASVSIDIKRTVKMRTGYTAYTILSPVFEKSNFGPKQKKQKKSSDPDHDRTRAFESYRDHAPVSVGGRARVWIFHNSVLWFIATSVIFHRAAYEIKWLIAREKERWRMRPSEEKGEREREGGKRERKEIYLSRSLGGSLIYDC